MRPQRAARGVFGHGRGCGYRWRIGARSCLPADIAALQGGRVIGAEEPTAAAAAAANNDTTDEPAFRNCSSTAAPATSRAGRLGATAFSVPSG